MRALPSRLTAALLLSVLAMCVQRAWTQSLVIDEAWVFERFADQPLVEMARSWDACNHVLHTLLMKMFRWIWGTSEHVLRLPSLLGAALYLTATYRLTALLFSGWRQPLAAALLALHPLVFDHMVVARGYGLALGLYMWAMYSLLRYAMTGWNDRWLQRAGVLAGLSIAANLTFGVPVAALGLVMWWMRRSWRTVDGYFGPAAVVAATILVLPLLNAVREDFYFGERNLLNTFTTFYATSLKRERSPFNTVGWAFAPYAPFALAMLCVVLSALGLWWLWQRRYDNFVSVPFALIGGTLGVCAVVWLLLDLRGVPCPSGRTGLYFIPLMTLATMLLLRTRRTAAVIGAAVALFYTTEIDNRFFNDWRWDAGTRDLVATCDADRAARGLTGDVRVAVPAGLSHTVRYYVLRRRMPWLKLLPPDAPDAQYLIADHLLLKQVPLSRYEVVARHALSGAALLRPLP